MEQATKTRPDTALLASGSIKFPEPKGEIRRTAKADIDGMLGEIEARKEDWVRLDAQERIQILDRVLMNLVELADEWVAESLRMKKDRPGGFAEGEEWGSLWAIIRAARIYRDSLKDIHRSGRPRIPGPVWERAGGQVVASVFPQSLYERTLFQGTTCEIWMQPEVTVEALHEEQAAVYRDADREGKVVLVLGAGNIPFLPFAQTIYQLFAQLRVVILKFNPVNAYIGPLMEQAFRPLIDRGYLRTAYGGVREGSYLCEHPLVEEIQLTGGDKTFNSIVFGAGDQQADRKARRDPKLKKPIEAELGNVSPVIVVPGPWDEGDINYQAAQLATWQAFNSGYYCLTPRVIIQPQGWDKRRALIDGIGDVFSSLETRRAWYPGTEKLHGKFMTEHPDARQYGTVADGHLPWTLIADVDPAQTDDIAFSTEGFCSLFSETALEADSVPEYLDRAVAFANDMLYGNLCATILVHPKSQKNAVVAAAVEKAIADLRYGTVCVNEFTGFAVSYVVTAWGGFPGNSIHDIQSGIGVINNALMFDRTQKSVVRSSFKKKPNPFSVTSKAIVPFARKLAFYDVKPSIPKLAGVLISALRA